MNTYSFLTVWQIDAPIELVWNALYEPERWPEWWPAVRRVTRLRDGDERGVGAVHRFEWRTPLGYALRFDSRTIRVEPPRVLEGRAAGELVGTGCWRLEPVGSSTTVRYTWDVSTSKRWMNLLAPVARPLFRWSHDSVMRVGGRRLAERLATPAGAEHG